jgi:arylsulfatase A-like enzyme
MPRSRLYFALIGLGLSAAVAALPATGAAEPATLAAGKRPNVLMIIVDDYAASLHDVAQAGPVRTPNLDRLAKRGTWFNRAYNASPICCASRTAILTGVQTSKTGIYYNNQAYRRVPGSIAKAEALPGHFRRNGYVVAGYGKIAHTPFMEDDVGDYTPGYYKIHNRVGDVSYTDEMLLDHHVLPGSRRSVPKQSNHALHANWNWDWGVLPDDWDRDDPMRLQQDTEQANRSIEFLRTSHDAPFMLICGFWRPHISWTVPKRYFDRYPLESIRLPTGYLPGDLDDLPKPARWIASHRGEHANVVAGGLWKECLQAYYASISYADEQVGRVLDALEKSPHNENTIVVFLADNGFHTGEKEHWLKFALWEQTCRVAFSIAAPGMKPQELRAPVGTIDIYPTLNRLCGLPAPTTHELDGVDLTPLLEGKNPDPDRAVLSTYGPGNHSIRNSRFRYIRYRDGNEELYDHDQDPHEWTNLAAHPRHAETKAKLAKHLPKHDAPQVAPPGVVGKSHAVWEDEAFEK